MLGANGADGVIIISYLTPVTPTITSLSPSDGPLAGGNTVTITGTGFVSGANAPTITVGGTSVTTTFVDTTHVTFTAPATTTVGVVDVAVTTNGGTSTTGASDHFTYAATPTVTAVSPSDGPTAGGTGVNITGTGWIRRPCSRRLSAAAPDPKPAARAAFWHTSRSSENEVLTVGAGSGGGVRPSSVRGSEAVITGQPTEIDRGAQKGWHTESHSATRRWSRCSPEAGIDPCAPST
jgi:hypothetical protein